MIGNYIPEKNEIKVLENTEFFLYKAVYLTVLLLLLMIGDSFAQQIPKRPNIIIIMADDMGYGDVGVYGSKIPTPNIDQLAQQGMYFTDAHSAGPTCTPSRYGILTGKYLWESNMESKGHYGYATPRIDPKLKTLPEFLQEHGYHTAAIGKWHLGLRWGLKDGAEWAGNYGQNIDYHKPITNGPLENGFDYYFGIPGSLDMPPYAFIENNHTVGIPSKEKKPKHTLQWNRGGLMTPGWKDKEVGPIVESKAEAFIHSHVEKNPDNPFFLYFAASAPHTPCVPPDFIKGKSKVGKRGDMVVQFDWSVGKIMGVLEELNLKKNTLLIVTSDNGGITTGPPKWYSEPINLEKYDINHQGHKPNGVLRGQKADIWEGAHRVPLVVRWPEKIQRNSINQNIVSLIDFYSTFAHILNKTVPKSASDSYSMWPAFQGNNLANRRVLIHRSQKGLFGIRLGSWKLINGRGSGGFTQPIDWKIQQGEPKGQLYNVDTDMSESRNLWNSHTKIEKKLYDKLKIYLENNVGNYQK